MNPTLLAIACIGLFSCTAVSADDFSLPSDAYTVNVTDPPYNAVGDGKTDCTAAFNAAIRQARGKNGWMTGVIYIPNGTYLVKAPRDELGMAKLNGLLTWGELNFHPPAFIDCCAGMH